MLPRVSRALQKYGNSTWLPANKVGALPKLMGAAYLVAIWRRMATSWFRNAPHKRRLWKKSSCLMKIQASWTLLRHKTNYPAPARLSDDEWLFLRQRILVAIALPSFFLCFHGEGAFNGIEWYGLFVWERPGILKRFFLKSRVRGTWRTQEL